MQVSNRQALVAIVHGALGPIQAQGAFRRIAASKRLRPVAAGLQVAIVGSVVRTLRTGNDSAQRGATVEPNPAP
jgi:hypothetical protein